MLMEHLHHILVQEQLGQVYLQEQHMMQHYIIHQHLQQVELLTILHLMVQINMQILELHQQVVIQ
jgi:hypothetical protein